MRNTSGKADFPEYKGTLILQTNNLGFYQKQETKAHPRRWSFADGVAW